MTANILDRLVLAERLTRFARGELHVVGVGANEDYLLRFSEAARQQIVERGETHKEYTERMYASAIVALCVHGQDARMLFLETEYTAPKYHPVVMLPNENDTLVECCTPIRLRQSFHYDYDAQMCVGETLKDGYDRYTFALEDACNMNTPRHELKGVPEYVAFVEGIYNFFLSCRLKNQTFVPYYTPFTAGLLVPNV